MKRMLQVAGILAQITVVFLMSEPIRATQLTAQSELVQIARDYLRSMTFPDHCSGPQRTLIAVSLAAAQIGTTNSSDIFDAYWIASGQNGDRLERSTHSQWINDAWQDDWRKTNTYNGVVEPLETLYEDNFGGGWINRERDLNTFDGSGRLHTSTNQDWVNDEFVNDALTTYVYGGSGNIIEVDNQLWNSETFINYARSLFSFSGNLLQTATAQTWNGSGWDNNTLSTYTYDGSDRVMQIVTQSWMGSVWNNLSRTTPSYNGMGYVSSSLTEFWDTGGWKDGTLNEFEYDGSGNQTLDRFWYWFGDVKTLYDIDTMKYTGGKLVEAVHNIVFGFPTVSRNLYSYDGDNLVEDIYQTEDLGFAASTDFVNSGRTTYEYESGGTAVQISDEPAPAGWELNQNYPNPFNPTTSIRYSLQRTSQVEVTVYNMLGQTVKTLESGVQAPGIYETTWDGRDATGKEVASGLYLYRISTDGFTETRKMMLLK